jgi:hypothetical protein
MTIRMGRHVILLSYDLLAEDGKIGGGGGGDEP